MNNSDTDYGRGRNVLTREVTPSELSSIFIAPCLQFYPDCLRDLIVPAMERMSNKVDFTLSYIGTPTDPDDGVRCKHGPTECLGNIIELCAAHLYPDPKLYLGFTMCLTNRYWNIPDEALVQNCALEHSLSFDKINECASDDSGLGIDMLRDSVTRSADANVTISCTVSTLGVKFNMLRRGTLLTTKGSLERKGQMHTRWRRMEELRRWIVGPESRQRYRGTMEEGQCKDTFGIRKRTCMMLVAN